MHETVIVGRLLIMSRQRGQVTHRLPSTVSSGSAFRNHAPSWSLKQKKGAKIGPAAPFLSTNSHLDCSSNLDPNCRLEFSPCCFHGDSPNISADNRSRPAFVEVSHWVKAAAARMPIGCIAPVDRCELNTGGLGFIGRKCSELRSCQV